MIDFQKLIPQIIALAGNSQAEIASLAEILMKAQAGYEEAGKQSGRFESLLKENGSNTYWPLAIPLETLEKEFSIEEESCPHSVVGIDGSQIMPSQHEIKSCFLLNIGAAVIHYADISEARLLSFPHLFHSHDEIYPLINKRRIHIDESLISFQRNLKELQEARRLAEQERAQGRRVLTLIDGSLIPFNIDRNIDSFQNELLEQFGMELDAYNAARLPLLAYISHSRSSDFVNSLRVWRCPYPESRCQLHCSQLNEEDYPCSEFFPLRDRQLFFTLLKRHHRSCFFISGSQWSNALKERNRICFAYLNTGQESARLELPSWLFEDKALLEFALQALLSQIIKGQGYPICLAEAHNMAVIKQSDRNRFYQILSEQLIKQGQARISISPKESKKRQGFV